MTETIYSLLDEDARNWWYNRRLREWGKHEEARRRERKSIRDHAKIMKEACENGGYMSLGGGWALHPDDGHTLSGYGTDGPFVLAVRRAGIPIIDIRDDPIHVISAPMVGIRKVDPPPWGWLSLAPLEVVARYYLERGATLVNFEPPLELEPDCRICSSCGHKLIAHYSLLNDSWCGCLECGCDRWEGFNG